MTRQTLASAPRPSRSVAVLPVAATKDRTGGRRRRWLSGRLIAVLLVVIAGAVAFHGARPFAPAESPRCETAIATRGSIEGLLPVSGRLLLDRPVRVYSDAAGRVVTLAVRAGDRVKVGQVMARLDDVAERASVMSAGAKVASAALLNLRAERELGQILDSMREQGLLTIPIEPDELLEGAAGDAQLEFVHTAAQGSKEQAALMMARAVLARRTIRAPVAGVVRGRAGEVGESIAGGIGGAPVFVIDTHPERLRLETEIDERYAAAIGPGGASFRTPSHWDETFAATIEGLVPRDGVASPGRYVVVLSVENGAGRLAAGMSAMVDLPARSPANATHVPAIALRSSLGSDASIVWISDRDGRPAPVPVSVGVTGEGLTEVAAPGLGAGAVVVVDPSPEVCKIAKLRPSSNPT